MAEEESVDMLLLILPGARRPLFSLSFALDPAEAFSSSPLLTLLLAVENEETSLMLDAEGAEGDATESDPLETWALYAPRCACAPIKLAFSRLPDLRSFPPSSPLLLPPLLL
jgi:hypothetical protein